MNRRTRLWQAAIVVGGAVALIAPASASAATTDLAISKSDSPDPVREGNVLTYTITVANVGPDAASGVVVTDELDSQVTFVSATASQGTCDRKGRTVTCTIGNLAANPSYTEGATITIRVRPKSAGQVTNTVTVAAGQGDTDPNPANNSASATTTVTAGPGGGGGGGAGATCGGRAATKVGTGGADVIVGTPRRDVIAARGGNDRVRGLGRGDIVCGGGGRDKLKGNAGGDKLKGGRGRDTLRGGPGGDKLSGGGGNDRCFGGPGRDTERSC